MMFIAGRKVTWQIRGYGRIWRRGC